MKNIKRILISFTLCTLFIGCGDGGSGSFVDENGEVTTPPTNNSGNTTPSSVTTTEDIALTPCETYTTLQTGDTIVKDETNTIVKIITASNGTKTACYSSGKAHIERIK